MTATEELRAMLDERRVKWMDDSYAQLWCTVWHGQDGKQWRMTENMSGMLTELKAWKATPAQAIEATLGRGACRNVGSDDWWECSECHRGIALFDPHERMPNLTDEQPRFCPNCGREVVE